MATALPGLVGLSGNIGKLSGFSVLNLKVPPKSKAIIDMRAWWSTDDLFSKIGAGNVASGTTWEDRVSRKTLTQPSPSYLPAVYATNADNKGPWHGNVIGGWSLAGAHGLPVGKDEAWIVIVGGANGYGAPPYNTGLHGFKYGNTSYSTVNQRILSFDENMALVAGPASSQLNYGWPQANAWQVIMVKCSEWARELWVDGTLVSSSYSLITDSTPITGITFGAPAGGDYTWPYNRDLMVTGPMDITQRQWLEGYLAWNKADVSRLPSNHPYKLFPPIGKIV